MNHLSLIVQSLKAHPLLKLKASLLLKLKKNNFITYDISLAF
jgi:hypothetical protein